MSEDLTGEQVWDFFSSVALQLVSNGGFRGLIIEGRSMVRSFEGLPASAQSQFSDIANTLNDIRRTADAIQSDTGENRGDSNDLGGPTVPLD